MSLDRQTLTRHERQIMEVLYRQGRASTARVREHPPDAPSYSAVRALLRLLENNGRIRHDNGGPRYVFFPKVSRNRLKQAAVQHLLQTFPMARPNRRWLPFWTRRRHNYPKMNWTVSPESSRVPGRKPRFRIEDENDEHPHGSRPRSKRV